MKFPLCEKAGIRFPQLNEISNEAAKAFLDLLIFTRKNEK